MAPWVRVTAARAKELSSVGCTSPLLTQKLGVGSPGSGGWTQVDPGGSAQPDVKLQGQ